MNSQLEKVLGKNLGRILGKIRNFELEWKSFPSSLSGQSQVRVAEGVWIDVRWQIDSNGLWIETPQGVFGYDVQSEKNDDGVLTYSLAERLSNRQWGDLSFRRVGALEDQGARSGKKKGLKVRAQMPGKIVRVLVKAGDEVLKDQPILVMEAMKMENEIRAAHAGRVSQVHVSEGQAVETGAHLLVIE